MKSIVAFTNELDDVEKAVAELTRQIEEKGPLCKNSLGMVYCDVEADHENFVPALQAKLPFGLVGGTTIATFDTDNGAQIMSIVLVVLTADDVVFSSAMTGALTEENLRGEMEEAYKKASAGLDGPGKLILLIPPFNDAAPLDFYVDVLSELSGDIPVFGGMPSSSMADEDIFMYGGGRPYNDRAAVVILSGNARPVFSVQNLLSSYSEQKFTVTKAFKNIIYEVDNMPFTEYLKSIGMAVDDLTAQDDLAVYVSTPFKVNLSKNDYNDGIPVVRIIKSLNPEDGSGTMFCAVPEKSTISVATMKRRDIQNSCKMAVEDIQRKIAAQGGDYAYSTLLCVSCGGRYVVMADDKELEGSTIVENLPNLPGMTFSGFYAYGEICPTVCSGGKALNRVHNESIVMCAL